MTVSAPWRPSRDRPVPPTPPNPSRCRARRRDVVAQLHGRRHNKRSARWGHGISRGMDYRSALEIWFQSRKEMQMRMMFALLLTLAFANGGSGLDPGGALREPAEALPMVTPYREPVGLGAGCPVDEGWCTCTARCTCIKDKQVAGCESLSGDEKSSCLSQAQQQYGSCWDDCYVRYGFIASNFSFC